MTKQQYISLRPRLYDMSVQHLMKGGMADLNEAQSLFNYVLTVLDEHFEVVLVYNAGGQLIKIK